MLMPFELISPRSLDEAVSVIAARDDGCTVMAGGTDVLVAMHKGTLRPQCVIDIKDIEELQGSPSYSEKGLIIPSLATHDEVEKTSEVEECYTALKDAISQIGSLQTRMRGTIGGNICNAAPSGDSIGALLVFDATLTLFGPDGWRTIAIADFFCGPKQTTLLPGEILCSISLPPVLGRTGSAYTKFSRRKAMDLALVGVAVSLGLDDEGVCNHARIALATAAPTPIRAKTAEAYLNGKRLDESAPYECEEALAEAAQLALADASPRSSWRSEADYRCRLIETLVPRTAKKALERLGKHPGRAE